MLYGPRLRLLLHKIIYPPGDMVRIWGCDVNVRSDMDTGGPSPLHTAIRHGALECVYVLLGYHADLNLVRYLVDIN